MSFLDSLFGSEQPPPPGDTTFTSNPTLTNDNQNQLSAGSQSTAANNTALKNVTSDINLFVPTFNPSITIGQSQNDSSVGRYSQQNATARTAVDANARVDGGSDTNSASPTASMQASQQLSPARSQQGAESGITSIFPVIASAGVGYGLGYMFGYPTYDSIIMGAIGGGSYLVGDLLSDNQVITLASAATIGGGSVFLMGQDPGTGILFGIASSGTGTAVKYLLNRI